MWTFIDAYTDSETFRQSVGYKRRDNKRTMDCVSSTSYQNNFLLSLVKTFGQICKEVSNLFTSPWLLTLRTFVLKDQEVGYRTSEF